MDVKIKPLRDIIFFIILVSIDQITKYAAKTSLQNGNVIDIIPNVFQLKYLENTGAAFGIFKGNIGFLIALPIITLLFFLFLFFKLPRTKHYSPLRFILILVSAGAIGNCIDRIVHSYVIDFLYFELIDFPIFNVADCYVTIGTFLTFLLLLFYYKEEDFVFMNRKKKVQEPE